MPSNPLHVLRVNARELLRAPGSVREIESSLDAVALGVDDERITGPVGVRFHVVSTIDGVVVSGTVTVPWAAPCRRCLTSVVGAATVEVEEVYRDGVGDADADAIEGDQIDLAAAVREYVLLELPDGPLCRDDCAGICGVCGTDRNDATCSCVTTIRDERWAALDELELGDD